jgi:hypothetical protein
MDIADATLGFFRDRISQSFTVAAGEASSLQLELLAAEPLRSGPSGVDPDRSFTLEFEGPTDAILSQGTFTVTHSDLDPAPIFLVPVLRTDNGVRYQAVFNRLA